MHNKAVFKGILFMLSCLWMIQGISSAHKPVVGWHWYNESHPRKVKKGSEPPIFERLSAPEQLKVLQKATTALRDKAVLTGSVSDIYNYKLAQDFWVARASRFSTNWEKALLLHPEVDYSIHHSHENAMAPIVAREESQNESNVIKKLAKHFGLLFFYRGKKPGDVVFSRHVKAFSEENHLALVGVSVDGVVSPALQKSKYREGKLKAHALGVDFFPAVVLVDPADGDVTIVSYGFKSEDELSKRLFKIATRWKETN